MLSLHLEGREEFGWYERRHVARGTVPVSPEAVFEFVDDPGNLTGHMSGRSASMGGGRMVLAEDAWKGRKIGSRLALTGSAFGMRLRVETIVTEHEPPMRKAWKTIGEPRLIVIGSYRMFVDLTRLPGDGLARPMTGLVVGIDYDLPRARIARLIARVLSGWYARWCTTRMLRDTIRHFTVIAPPPAALAPEPPVAV